MGYCVVFKTDYEEFLLGWEAHNYLSKTMNDSQ